LPTFNKIYPFKHAHQGILLNSNDRYVKGAIAAHGEFSEDEVDMFRDILQPTDIVIEVGANMGAHTLALAELATGVVAFEPQRYMFQVLAANVALNSLTNVVALPYAIGATEGSIRVPVNNPEAEDFNFGSQSLVEEEPVGEQVQLLRLDSFAVPHLALIKIDCEGMEVDVLKGGAGLIRRTQPWIYLEFTSNRQAIMDLLRSWNYKLFRHFPRHSRTPNHLGVELDPTQIFASDMLLACPADRPPRENMIEGFGKRHGLVEPSTEDVLGHSLQLTIWEPYVRID